MSKELREKAAELNGPVDSGLVQRIIKYLGEQDLSPVSINSLEAVVDHFKKQLKDILGKDLLEWMNENDLTSFEDDDFKVSIKTYVSSKVVNPDAAFKWLNENQYGDLIKDTLDFPKGELTEEVEAFLDEQGLSYTKKSGIHPQSLKKIMSTRLQDGEELPDADEHGIAINYYDECAVKAK